MTRVVDVKTEAFDMYIGRAVPRARDPRCRKKSVYANPYRIGLKPQCRTREQALVEYESLWRSRLAGKSRHLWHDRLMKLRGKRLGCWCAPNPCHGDVLIKLLEEFDQERR